MFVIFTQQSFIMNIPVADLSLFINGTPEHKVQFAADLGKAFEEVGEKPFE